MSTKKDQSLSLVDNLWRLKKGIEKNFDYHVSLKMLLSDLEYRAEAINKAKKSNIPKLLEITEELSKHADEVVESKKSQSVSVNSNTPQAVESASKESSSLLKYGIIAAFFLIVSFFAFDYFSMRKNLESVYQNQQQVSSNNGLTDQSNSLVTEEKPLKKEFQFSLVGSNTVGEKLAPALVTAFIESKYPNTQVALTNKDQLDRDIEYQEAGVLNQVHLSAHGSSTSFKGLLAGDADIGMASRRIKDKEHANLMDKVGDLRQFGNEHVLAMDGLAVIVNANNPLSQLTKEAIAKLFKGEITNWSELGGNDLPVRIYARAEGSGTLDTFKSLVMKPYKYKIAPDAFRFESSSELSDKVASEAGAIGFIGLPYVRDAKALAVAENSNTMAIYPTAFTISTEDYPLSRRLYFYTKANEKKPLVKEFIRFALSYEGQKVVEKVGLISQNIKTETIAALSEQPSEYRQLVSKGKRLSLNFRFQFGTNRLDNKSAKDVQRLTDYLSSNRGRQVILAGFCDSVGDEQKNKYLSLQRANAIKQELVSRGLNVKKTLGFGEALPLSSNETESGRKKNRRVEVWVI